MRLRFISPKTHGLFDYLLDASLLVIPWLLGFAGRELWLPVGVGIANATYSALTSYGPGLVPLLPFGVHLRVDLALGFAMAAAPLALGLVGQAHMFHLGVGVGIIVFVALTLPEHQPAPVVEARRRA